MATNEFGKAIRKGRIDAEVSLNDMATAIGASPAFLSAIETGRKKIPKSWVEVIQRYFGNLGYPIENLQELADISNQNVSLEGLSPSRQMAVAVFARRNWDESQLESFNKLLGIKG